MVGVGDKRKWWKSLSWFWMGGIIEVVHVFPLTPVQRGKERWEVAFQGKLKVKSRDTTRFEWRFGKV